MAMMRGRIVCIYIVSSQECGRELRRRPERMNIVSNHRDPLHVGETALSCNTQWTVNVHVLANISSSSPFVTLWSV